MASVYRPSGRSLYRIEFKDQHGVTRTVSSGMKDRRAAEELARKIEQDAQRQRAGMVPLHPDVTGPYLQLSMAGRSWKEFREEYRHNVLAGLARRTQEEAEGALDLLEQSVQPKAVADVTAKALADFVGDRRQGRGKKKGSALSPATINKNLRHLKAALLTAAEWGYLRKDAIPAVPFQGTAEHMPRYMPPEHFTAIYQACAAARMPEGLPYSPAVWWRALMMVLYTTGWRIGQALALRRDALDLAADPPTAFFPAEVTKGKRDVYVALAQEAAEHLRHLDGPGDLVFPWLGRHHRTTLFVEWRRIQGLAKVKGEGGADVLLSLPCRRDHEHTDACHRYGFHDLRRAFATMNVDRLSPEELQRTMQHQRYQTTQGYINLGRLLKPSALKVYVPPTGDTGQAGQEAG